MSVSPTPTVVDSVLPSDLSLLPSSYWATVTSISPAITSMLKARYDGDDVSDDSPYLDVLPAFTYSMPVQVVILGVTVTLLGVLLVHLLFTIRYHLPLSKTNYAFQTTAVILSLCNVSAQLQIVMSNLVRQGRRYPFAFDYIEVAMPPSSWSQSRRGAWLFLQGLNSFVTHSTHIQFLTMLFPSALEARLIFFLLGPLALATGGLYLTSLSPHAAVNDLGDAIRNTANSSLTLLYTLALFIWGFALNRSRAWRAEGGTSTFGTMALVLGVLGTAVNFVEIKEDRMRWLPGVVTCVLLWQSWVGFWWWVGAGMWTGEAEDVERREAKKRRRAEAKKLKREANQKGADVNAAGTAVNGSTTGSTMRRRGGRYRTGATAAAGSPEVEAEAIELRDLGDRPEASNESVSSGSTPPPSHHFYTPVLSFFAPFFARLRVAHDAAAVAKAALPPGLPDDVRRGWGIRALMLKGKRERGERRQAAVGVVDPGGEVDAGERRAGFQADGGEQLGGEEWEEDLDGDISATRSSMPPASGSTAEGTSESESYPPRAGRAPTAARLEMGEELPRRDGNLEGQEPDWAGRGMDGQWRGWRAAIARWRLADVSKY